MNFPFLIGEKGANFLPQNKKLGLMDFLLPSSSVLWKGSTTAKKPYLVFMYVSLNFVRLEYLIFEEKCICPACYIRQPLVEPWLVVRKKLGN